MLSSSPETSISIPDRPQSARSMSSNSSISSGVSLTRRSRTRTRSRTVTGPPNPSVDSTSQPDVIPRVPPRVPNTLNPQPSTSNRSLASHADDSAVGEVTLVACLPQSSPMPLKLSKAAKQASHLASIETSYNPALSAFARDPELTPNARDSFSTQKSSTSSFYPPSTSTISKSESRTSPPAAAEEVYRQQDISSFIEDVGGMQNYDGDDVAYRLRLLVKNNYFLPPAHMKPSPEDFAASTNAKKSPTPTFLDIFRVGKSRSRPTLITSALGSGPMLRTTSDTITSPFTLRNHQRALHSPHNMAFPLNGSLDRGRVAVVRERVTDIAVAAKQAEQEMKTRNARRDSDRGRRQLQTLVKRQVQDADDVIDPTDAVDIPLPASNYPFAVQASALHGLGVQESVGAAILADRLPPNSPGMSSAGETDDHWRKVLLQQAVHHSLDNTPDESMFSYAPGTSNPMLATPRVNGELSRSTTPGMRAKRLQKHIVEPQISFQVEGISMEAQIGKEDPVHKSEQSQTSTSRSTYKSFLSPDSNDSRRSSFLPARAITPLANVTPLTPAPRAKEPFSITYSHSHSDLQHQGSDVHSLISPKAKLRRSMSTPLFTEFESMRQQFAITPPLPPVPGTRRSSQMTQLTVQTHSYETTGEIPSRGSAFSSQLTFDDCDGRIARGSPRLSALGNRCSFLSFSQGSMSPTTSAFQDALNHAGERSSMSSMRYSSLDESTEPDTRTRSSLASPPPRTSTSNGHNALQPPPRSSSFNYSLSSLNRNATSSEPRIEISAASPTKGEWGSSPYVSSSHHDVRPIPFSLDILTSSAEVAIHSPAPSSPTSFFDTLQTQPNAMDDLDSSDDDDEATSIVAQSPPPPSILSVHSSPPTFLVDPRTRANSTISTSPIKPSTMMRLGNFSAPYIGRGHAERLRMLPIRTVDSKKALGYTPTRAQFFSERKSDLGHGKELSTTLIVQAQAQAQAQKKSIGLVESPVETSAASSSSSVLTGLSNIERRRPTTVSRAVSVSPTSPLRQQFTPQRPEALKKFDGMLVQHMEEEKDRIKKIAGAIKSSPQAACELPEEW